ncbi:hypothetical protein DPMN_050239, partial [Dreissena polymorpha]
TNDLTKFCEDWTVLFQPYKENCPHHCSNVFLRNLNNLSTQPKYHNNKCSDKVSRILNHKFDFNNVDTVSLKPLRKTAPPPGGHVFRWTDTIFELSWNIIITYVPNKFHKIGQKNFKLSQDIIGTNVLTKFHENLTINLASTVLKRYMLTTHNR